MRIFKATKKIVALTLCAAALSVSLCACATKPPEYSEIEGRFKELVLASGEVNMLFFGEGLETHPRVTDPKSTMKVYIEETVGEDGEEKKVYHYYYQVPDEGYDKVIAYRKSYLDDFIYLSVSKSPIDGKEIFHRDEARDRYYYVIEGYSEPDYTNMLLYDENDPADYDYVRINEKYRSVNDIKAAAEAVYSKGYLDAIYTTMFVGGTGNGDANEFSARYIEYADGEGNVSLMKSNKYDPLISEVRVFDFDTAEMIKPSNGEFVTISIESYLPSAPDKRLTVKLTMILENGVWMLDSATY